MNDPRIERWAKLLTGYCVDVQPGQTVAIAGGVAAEPLLRAIYCSVIERGGFPVHMPEFTGLTAELIASGNDDQLQFLSPAERFGREVADVYIRVGGETNTRCGSMVDPARNAFYDQARPELRQTFGQRAALGNLRWTLTIYPADAYAQDAEMSTDDYQE